MSAAEHGAVARRPAAQQVQAVVDATRSIGALIAASLVAVDPPVTMPQWRVLVLAAEGPVNLSAVADDLGIHPSNATRLCDRLVSAGLVVRSRADDDRRQVLLVLTASGRRLYAEAMELRRVRVERAMTLMSAEDRAALAAAMTVFSKAVAQDHGSAV